MAGSGRSGYHAAMKSAMCMFLASLVSAVAAAASPSVKVQGNHLIDANGNILQLRGVNASGLEFTAINGQPQPDD